MRSVTLAFSIFLAAVTAPGYAADLNGYSSPYECRDGGPNCNVNIQQLLDLGCGQIITPSMPWSAIDWSKRTICLAPGDHFSGTKGTLTIPSSANGTAQERKVLRAQIINGKPWEQSAPRVRRIVVNGDYWFIHNLELDSNGNLHDALLDFPNGADANSNIADSLLIENGKANGVRVAISNDNNTIQNSVIRNCTRTPGRDWAGVMHDGGPINTHTVNNEIYGCAKGVYISEHEAPGTVIENNDLYVPSSLYTDCNGNYNGVGPCGANEAQIGAKNGGTPASPVKILHNRVWGARVTDSDVCCNSGGQGTLVFLGGKDGVVDDRAVKYTLFQNNILMDGQSGITGYWEGTRNNSYVGNIIHDIHQHYSGYPSSAINSGAGDKLEWYFNTVIDADKWDIADGPYGGKDNDLRCNIVINSGASSAADTGTQIANNAFFNTTPTTTASPSIDVVGTSESESQNDQFCFHRKLRTGPEEVCIPRVRPTAASPHRNACQPVIGSRTGIGIDDAGLSNASWNDWFGLARDQATPAIGALEHAGVERAPFPGPNPAALPGVLQAENYDTGGEGVAYHDDSAGNRYGNYRSDDVDIGHASGTYYIAENKAGEWLEYSVDVQAAGTYLLEIRVASNGQGGRFHVEFDGENKTGEIIIPNTNSWSAWTILSVPVTLDAGAQTLRIEKDANGATGYVGNIDYLRVVAVGNPYPAGAAWQVPGTVEAENYDLGGEGVAYHDTTPGNRYANYRSDDVDIGAAGTTYYVAENKKDEWLDYTIFVQTAGDYTVEFRVASNGSGGKFYLEFDGVKQTDDIPIPNTSGWSTWTTMTRTVNLSAGHHVMRIVKWENGATGYVGNIDYLRFIQ